MCYVAWRVPGHIAHKAPSTLLARSLPGVLQELRELYVLCGLEFARPHST